jgi:hypothetical protein
LPDKKGERRPALCIPLPPKFDGPSAKMKTGIPKNTKGKAYKRYLKRLKEIDKTISKGSLPTHWPSNVRYNGAKMISGGLPGFGKRR